MHLVGWLWGGTVVDVGRRSQVWMQQLWRLISIAGGIIYPMANGG